MSIDLWLTSNTNGNGWMSVSTCRRTRRSSLHADLGLWVCGHLVLTDFHFCLNEPTRTLSCKLDLHHGYAAIGQSFQSSFFVSADVAMLCRRCQVSAAVSTQAGSPFLAVGRGGQISGWDQMGETEPNPSAFRSLWGKPDKGIRTSGAQSSWLED